MAPKVYRNTGTAKAPVAVILFLAFYSGFHIIINPYPANVENMVSLLVMPADGRWDSTRCLKG
jgi:hypothetical protein